MKIAVYCGADFGEEPAYIQAARDLGKWIADNGHELVYGGGDAGLMGTVAKAAFENGAHVYGVIPENVGFIKDRPQPYVSELIVTNNMSDRKEKMLEIADAFIALPGGIGTMDEITEAIVLTKIGVFKKACVFFDRNGFYQPFRKMLDEMERVKFIMPGTMGHVLFSDDFSEIDKHIIREIG